MKQISLKKNLLYKFISMLLTISSICFLGFLFYLNLLPAKYSTIISIVVLIFSGLNIFLINLKHLKKKIKKILSIFMIIGIIAMTCANFYMAKTLGVLLSNGDSKYKLEHYSVIVLDNSKYKKITDIKNEEVGYFENSTGAKEANKKLQEDINVMFKSYNASNALVNDLLDSKVNVIVLEDSIKNIMKEEIVNFEKDTKVIHTFTIKTKVETTLKEVNVTIEPFAVYISGIDTYGQISSVSRSDVNMVMVVNPETHQILLISIPRDYYVQLHGTTGTKDKLTHAGIYGIDMSIKTIEDLLELDINYYIKVNFTSVIDIVDALGGLDVYSEYTFTSYSGYRFKKGMNSVNGEQALDFARTRKAFKEGDRQRGKNQQALIKAMIDKVIDKSIITKYSLLLDAVNGKYQTNMSVKALTSLVKAQLKDMSGWNVHSYSLLGKDETDYTYTYNQLLYVMKPDEESVAEAISLIDAVLKGTELENSYLDLGGTSNKVTQVPKPLPSQLEQNSSIDDIPKEDDELNDEIKGDNPGDEINTELPDQSGYAQDNGPNQNEPETPIDKTPDDSNIATPEEPEELDQIETIVPQE
ncbi:MAG: LCP family protein [Bacilli bacterium]|nr:LCP family protein [Bacilli bacterium]